MAQAGTSTLYPPPLVDFDFVYGGNGNTVNINDLVLATGSDCYSAGDAADLGSKVANQIAAVKLFAGVSREYKPGTNLSGTTPAGSVNCWLDTGVQTRTVVSGTFNVGDMLTFSPNPGNAGGVYTLDNQLLEKTTDPALAIAIVTQKYASSVTSVQCIVRSRLILGLSNAPLAPVKLTATGSAIGNAAAVTVTSGVVELLLTGQNQGVQLPVAVPGMQIEFVNSDPTNVGKIYPQAGASINGGAANGAVTINNNSISLLIASEVYVGSWFAK